MNRYAFTLVEVLAAVSLSAALVAAGGSWLLGLQRSAVETRSQCRRSTALATVAVRLREDLNHATADQPIGARDSHGAWLMTITGAQGQFRQNVTWSVRDGGVVRSCRPLSGGRWNDESIADGIDSLELVPDPARGVQLRLKAGSGTLILDLVPGTTDAP